MNVFIICREIDKEEFKKVMALMRACNRQGAQHRGGLRFGLKARDSVENGGLVEFFFGEDGNTRLHLDKFIKFLRDLQNEVRLQPFSSLESLHFVISIDCSHVLFFFSHLFI